MEYIYIYIWACYTMSHIRTKHIEYALQNA
jgi:hypothetical protein